MIKSFNEDISLLVNEIALLQSSSDVRSINQGVVETFGSSLGFSKTVELEESVIILFLGNLVNTDDSLENIVAQLLDELVEIQLIVIFWQVSHIDRGKLLSLCLTTVVALILA